MRPSPPPLTESLAPGFVQEVDTTLFLLWEGGAPPEYRVYPEWEDKLGVSSDKLQHAIKRGLKGNTALGPDGIPKRI